MKKKILWTLIFMSLVMMNTMQVFAADGSGDGSGISIGLCIIVGLIVAGIACAIASSSMKSVHTATSAKHYEKQGSFNLTNKVDNHINTTQQRIHHERSTPS
ncbi:MAG: hypothetical protein IJS12_04505 [Lachnospiraceae bacterium]|nr:hypothetical protein [Lachnospiraceae bacterium]